jgi:hypothetical protein
MVVQEVSLRCSSPATNPNSNGGSIQMNKQTDSNIYLDRNEFGRELDAIERESQEQRQREHKFITNKLEKIHRCNLHKINNSNDEFEKMKSHLVCAASKDGPGTMKETSSIWHDACISRFLSRQVDPLMGMQRLFNNPA